MEPNMKPVFRRPSIPPSKWGLLSLEKVLGYGDKDPEKDEDGGDVGSTIILSLPSSILSLVPVLQIYRAVLYLLCSAQAGIVQISLDESLDDAVLHMDDGESSDLQLQGDEYVTSRHLCPLQLQPRAQPICRQRYFNV